MKKYLPLISILALALVLRFYHNTLISLWYDESFSALMIRYPWGEMIHRLGLDVHPPMYYIFLRFWHYIFGDSQLSLRGFSILFGAAASWAGYLFTKEAFKNEKAAIWAALLIALNPFQLQYVTEARMYTMGAFFALLAGYFLVKALNRQKELLDMQARNMPNLPEAGHLRKSMIYSYAGFTLSMIIIIYTHYYLFFTAAALGLYALIFLIYHHERWSAKKYIYILSSFAIIGLSFAPWLKTFLYQYRQVGAGYWIPPINIWSIPSTFWDMLLGFERDTNNRITRIMLVVVTVFSFYVFYRIIKKNNSFHKWLVLFAVAAPFGGAILFEILAKLKGSSSSVYMDRYFLFASIFYSIAIAVWLKEISIKWLSIGLFTIYCLVNFYAFVHYWQQLDVKTKPGIAAAGKYLAANATPKDKIYAGSSWVYFTLEYYWFTNKHYTYPNPSAPDQIRPLMYSGGTKHASEIAHFAGSPMLSDEQLLPDFDSQVHPGDTVWLVWTNGFGSNKPDQIPANWAKVDEKSYADVRPWVGTYVYVTEYRVN